MTAVVYIVHERISPRRGTYRRKIHVFHKTHARSWVAIRNKVIPPGQRKPNTRQRDSGVRSDVPKKAPPNMPLIVKA